MGYIDRGPGPGPNHGRSLNLEDWPEEWSASEEEGEDLHQLVRPFLEAFGMRPSLWSVDSLELPSGNSH